MPNMAMDNNHTATNFDAHSEREVKPENLEEHTRANQYYEANLTRHDSCQVSLQWHPQTAEQPRYNLAYEFRAKAARRRTEQQVGEMYNMLRTLSDSFTTLNRNMMQTKITQQTALCNLSRKVDSLDQSQEGFKNSITKTIQSLIPNWLRRSVVVEGDLESCSCSVPIAIGEKVSDSEIRSIWRNLEFQIRSLSMSLANLGWKLNASIPTELSSILADILNLSREARGNDEYQSILIEACIWRFVSGHIFEGKCDLWQSKSIKALKRLRKLSLYEAAENPDALRKLSPWLSDGLICVATRVDEVKLDRYCVDQFMALVDIFQEQMDEDAFSSRLDIFRPLFADFTTIISVALDFDIKIMSSRAYIFHSVEGLHPYSAFDAATANCKYGSISRQDGVVIELMISPMLMKFGTATGRIFEAEMVLAKGQVVCNTR